MQFEMQYLFLGRDYLCAVSCIMHLLFFFLSLAHSPFFPRKINAVLTAL